MGRIIAVANQKGGVGKTTTSINLSAALAEENKKILVIDADPQGNTTSGFGLDKNEIDRTIYHLMIGECSVTECIRHDIVEDLPGIDIIPSNINLSAAEIELIDIDKKEYILKNEIDKVKDNYDFIIIDCPPSLSMLTINALGAADSVLIPVQPTKYSLDGLADLVKLVIGAQSTYNKNLVFEGIVYTLDTPNQVETRNIKADVEDAYGANIRIHETSIPRLKDISSSPSYGVSVFDIDPDSKGASAYAKLAREVLENG